MKNTPTLTEHLLQQQRKYPEKTKDIAGLLANITLAAKVISREINRAGLVEILGLSGNINVHGEEVQKLDEFANQVFKNVLIQGGHVCIMASEEEEKPIEISEEFPGEKYTLTFDPLDGSSNIDANVSVGTIFSIHEKISSGEKGILEDLLQPGKKQVGAGYIIYGSSTMFIYSCGQGVHGFTLDPGIGEFLLSHEDLRVPDVIKVCSVNESYYHLWSEGVKRYLDDLKKENRAKTARYIGSLVADFHRNLHYGGIFLYPATTENPQGKLRLLYEAAPLAYIIKEAGGYASDGQQSILDIEPKELHQRVPLFIGNKEEVKKIEEYLKRE